jgi:ammonia channel protein AmtB
VATFIVILLTTLVVDLRVNDGLEADGLDLNEHGERIGT